MQLFLSSTLTTLAVVANLMATGFALVMDVYGSKDCSGSAKSVNVWDNTRATGMGGFQSYIPRVYRGTHQHAYFFAPSNCGSLPGAISNSWADGGGFKISMCYNLGGHVANAVASYAG